MDFHKHLLGKKFNGATIDELVCIPVGYEDEYRKCYIKTLNGEQAFGMLIKILGVLPLDADYQIYAVLDKFRLTPNGVLTLVNVDEIIY